MSMHYCQKSFLPDMALLMCCGMSLDIAGGEIVAVLGSNGVGKTTLNNTLSGLIKPNREVIFEGSLLVGASPETIVDLGVNPRARGAKATPNLSVRDNLELGSYRRGKSERAANLDDVLDTFPKLRDRINHDSWYTFRGEQQMVAIGRGLMSSPKLLILMSHP